MLVLSRHVGETIRVGRDITIHIQKLHGARVQIAIDAPDHVRILRGELADQSEIDKEDAA